MKKIVAAIVMGALLFTGVYGYAWGAIVEELYEPEEWDLSGLVLFSADLWYDTQNNTRVEKRVLIGIDLETGEWYAHDRDAYPIQGDGEYRGLVAEERDGVAYIYETDGREMWNLLFEYPLPSEWRNSSGYAQSVRAYMNGFLYYYVVEEDGMYLLRDDMQGNIYRYAHLPSEFYPDASRYHSLTKIGSDFGYLQRDGALVQKGYGSKVGFRVQFADGSYTDVTEELFETEWEIRSVWPYGWMDDDVILVCVYSVGPDGDELNELYLYHADRNEAEAYPVSIPVMDEFGMVPGYDNGLSYIGDGTVILGVWEEDGYNTGPMLFDLETGRLVTMTKMYSEFPVPELGKEAYICGKSIVIWIND